MTELKKTRYTLEKGWRLLFQDLGIPTQDVLRHAQLPLDLFSRKAPTVSADDYLRFWHALAHVTREEPTFPLRLTQTITAETFSPPMFAALSSDNLNTALNRLAQYKPLVGPLCMSIEQNKQYTRVTIAGLPQGGPIPTILILFELGFWVHMARLATRERINPLAVYVALDVPEVAAYEQFFGTHLTRCEFNRLTFSAEDARKPFLTANHAMWAIFEPEFTKRLQDLTQQSSFHERVRACLMEILASGQYSMADVAQKLAMSTRTLHRRLQNDGTTFQRVLDELREELARYYLTSSDYSSAEIAFLLGYEEPNSFYRAFRVWTGQTPEAVRQNG